MAFSGSALLRDSLETVAVVPSRLPTTFNGSKGRCPFEQLFSPQETLRMESLVKGILPEEGSSLRTPHLRFGLCSLQDGQPVL